MERLLEYKRSNHVFVSQLSTLCQNHWECAEEGLVRPRHRLSQDEREFGPPSSRFYGAEVWKNVLPQQFLEARTNSPTFSLDHSIYQMVQSVAAGAEHFKNNGANLPDLYDRRSEIRPIQFRFGLPFNTNSGTRQWISRLASSCS